MIPTNEDLKEIGLNLLLYQFSDKTNITKILEAYSNGLKTVQDDLFTLVDNFNVDDATGVYLDYVGKLVGEKREEDNDNDFKQRIKSRVLINNSKGTPNDLLEILSELTSTNNVRIWEHFPVSTVMYTDGRNATVRTLQSIQKSSPITSDAVLIVDTTRRGFVGTELLPNYPSSVTKKDLLAELLESFDFVVNENNDNIVNENGDTLVAFTGGGDTVSYYGIFNEVIT